MRVVILLLLLGLPLPAQDGGKKRVSRKYREVLLQIQRMQRGKPPSISIGHPNTARLEHAAELPAKGYGYRMDSALRRKTNFGTDEMVFGLMILGAETGDRYGRHGTFYIGDIGRREGGKLSPHISHQGGRDADIGLFFCDAKGRPQGNEFRKVDAEGKAKGTLRFDLKRNWDFVCLMLDNPFWKDHIRFILLDKSIKALLLKYAEDLLKTTRHPAQRDYIKKHIQLAEKHLSHQKGHDNHYHLRVKCTREDNAKG